MRASHTATGPSMSESASRRGALVAMILLTLIWSYNWIVMKEVLRDCGPFHFAAWRAVLATGVLFAVILLRGESLRPPPWRSTLAIGLAQTTGFQALVQSALVTGGAGKTALLAYTMPFWLLLLAWIALGERPRPLQWASIGLAGLGLLLVLEPWHGFAASSSALLALASGLCWAVAVVLSKRLLAGRGLSPLRLTAWQMLFGTIGLVAIALVVPERPIAWTVPFIAALAYNAVLASGLAWVMWSVVVQRLPATVAGITSLAVPLTGVLLAWALLGERPGRIESIGIALLAVAMLGITRAPRAS